MMVIKLIFNHLLLAFLALELVQSFTTTTIQWQPSIVSLSATPEYDSKDYFVDPNNVGLYRRFCDHVQEKLQESGMFESIDDLPSQLSLNQATQNRGGTSSMVQIQNFAMKPTGSFKDVVRYSRVALLETIDLSNSSSGDDGTVVTHTEGIQVLNFIIVPSAQTDLPVLGIDLVRLPGDKNLLLLDAQPMVDPNPYQENWKAWYAEHVGGDAPVFSWGGDFPPPVQQYVSPYALWTRLQPPQEVSGSEDKWDPTSIIQNELWDAFTSHLDIYLDLLRQQQQQQQLQTDSSKTNNQAGYLEYRRTTDPAKPMLKALYGEEWTQQVLDEVLFPTWME
ncbi:unnamed protein product [Cylindrotheca closterium]|uniref:Phycoerythrobilin:ferredoxin oxidoreductase n=1 Tax=Cylindrotheca closterium TaxID=2856 RepID=A0AAD2JL00_9STRA|nr:unnamed protein product [Cylindrotheca closterium]